MSRPLARPGDAGRRSATRYRAAHRTGCKGGCRGIARGELARGSAIAEFALLAGIVAVTVMAVVQLAVFLYQRNVVMAAVADGARAAASLGRGAEDGRTVACQLIRQAIGERCAALNVTAGERGGLVVVAADGRLPPLAPGLPPLRIRHVATMHDEDVLYPGTRPW